jgi:hypothetical protein
VAEAAVIIAFGVLLFLVFGLQECIEAWLKGKANVEAQKTRQEELKLERAKLEHDKQPLT